MSWDTGATNGAWDGGAAAADDTWKDDSPATGFDGGETFGDASAGAAGGDEAFDGECNVCHQTGHRARDCPDKPAMECFNCGQTGHSKAECTNEKVEREFTGECNVCHATGHMARDCPEKPADKCRICEAEGHKAIDCTAKRQDMFKDAAEMTIDEAWKAMQKADLVKDLDAFRPAFFAYMKHMFMMAANGELPPMKLSELEEAFRAEKFNIHLIAKKKELNDQFTYVSAAGEINQKYHLTLEWSAEPRRRIFAKGWPETPEENLERLNDAGFPIPTLIPKCDNCNKLGHIRKHCKEEMVEKTHERPKIKCIICGDEGHRARDCTQRPVEECRRCHQEGHRAVDCPNGDSRPARTCRNCGEEGHIGKDCTAPPNPANMQCRNCDEMGHMSKECPKPTDWSKVRCRECGEMGHTIKRCPQAAAAAAGTGGDGGFEPATGGDSGGWGAPDAGVPIEVGGGGW